MVKIKYIFLMAFLLLLVSSTDCFSQMASGEYVDYKYLKSGDTIRMHRKHADWWFGAFGGFSTNFNFGSLNLVKDPDVDILDKRTISYPGGVGTGIFLGLQGDWLPVNKKWGASFKLSFLDYRSVTTETEPYAEDNKQKYFESQISYNSIIFSPSARYNFKFSGFNIFGGLDFEFRTGSSIKESPKENDGVNTRTITTYNLSSLANVNFFRFGLHLGTGFDLYSADINQKVRFYLSPFASVHFGTNVFSDWNSSRNQINIKIGLALRFCPDVIIRDTLKYDSNYVAPPRYLATVQKEQGVNFPGFTPYIAQTKGTIERPAPQIAEQIAEVVPSIQVEESAVPKPSLTEEKQKKKISITRGYKGNFVFATSASSTIQKKDRDILDAVAEEMKKDPNLRLQIVGHSDNTGTTDQNTSRAKARAEAVANYLARQGVSKKRLLVSNKGSLDAIADNSTEAGRKKNRRVEFNFTK